MRLITDLRHAQGELARLGQKGGETESIEVNTSVESFLAQLPDLWRQGESRPTHRRRPVKARTWRTRMDPFEEVWPQVREWLEEEPDITGKALFHRVRGNYPGEFAPGQLRTLQRRVREWRQAVARELLSISTAPN